VRAQQGGLSWVKKNFGEKLGENWKTFIRCKFFIFKYLKSSPEAIDAPRGEIDVK